MMHKVGVRGDLSVGRMKEVQLEGRSFLLVNINGYFYAMEGRCSHMGGVLANGTLDGFVVQCPRHGARFDVRTGNVVSGSKIPLIGKAKQMNIFQVKVEGEDIYLDL